MGLGLAVLAVCWTFIAPNFVRSGTSPKNGCIHNLKQLDGAVQQWAIERNLPANSVVNWAEAPRYLFGNQLPRCPTKSTYKLGKTVGELPRCSVPGHTL